MCMNSDDGYAPSVSIRVVRVDLPDMIDIEGKLSCGDWSGVACAYASPKLLAESASKLATWAEMPAGEAVIEAGEDTGIGWLRLRFYPIGMARHVTCHVQMATSMATVRPRQGRLEMEIATEPGLIIRFAKDLESLSLTQHGEAVLEGIA